MKFELVKDYIYNKNECNEQKLNKGSIVTFHSSYSKGYCWVNFNNARYLVNSKDLLLVK